MQEKKSLKELCSMRDALEEILLHEQWLGVEIEPRKALAAIKNKIANYEEYQKGGEV